MTRRPVYLFCFLFPPLFWAVCQVGSLLPNQGSNPYTLQWKHRVLTTGLPGKNFAICLLLLLKQITTNSMVQNNTTIIPYSSICQKSDWDKSRFPAGLHSFLEMLEESTSCFLVFSRPLTFLGSWPLPPFLKPTIFTSVWHSFSCHVSSCHSCKRFSNFRASWDQIECSSLTASSLRI